MDIRFDHPNSQLTEIYQMLYQFGLRADCAGFFFLSYAVYLSVCQPNRLLFPSKWVFPAIAQHYHTTVPAVRSGIHSVSGKVLSSVAIGNPEHMIAVLTRIYHSNKAA